MLCTFQDHVPFYLKVIGFIVSFVFQPDLKALIYMKVYDVNDVTCSVVCFIHTKKRWYPTPLVISCLCDEFGSTIVPDEPRNWIPFLCFS